MTFSPASAARRKRIVSRTRWYGLSNGMPFQRSTITFDDVPIPSAKRPGAAWHIDATVDASVCAPRVYAGHDRGAEPQLGRPLRGDRRAG